MWYYTKFSSFMKQFTFLLVFIFALSACKSVDKLYQEGNYKQIISKLEGKAKKGNLDRKEKGLLVKAANKYAQEINTEVISSMEIDKPSEWIKSKRKLEKLDEKLLEIKNYSQIREDDIDASRYEELYPQLNEKLYDYTINEYDAAIANYDKTGNRDYAVKAHAHTRKLYDYDGDPDFIKQLEIQAIDLGHRTIYVDLDGPMMYSFLFRNHFENQIDLDNDLFNTFIDFGSNVKPDYTLEIEVDITRKDTDKKTRQDRYTDRVVDYYDNVIDTSTNTTNKVPVYKDIEAIVETAEILRYVEGEYDYDIRDERTNRRFDNGRERQRVERSEVIYTLISGDEDAVPSNIDLSSYTISTRQDYDDLIEELFRILAEDFNDDVRIKNKLL